MDPVDLGNKGDCVEMPTLMGVVGEADLGYGPQSGDDDETNRGKKRRRKSTSPVSSTGNLKCHVDTCVKQDTHDEAQLIMSQCQSSISLRPLKLSQNRVQDLLLPAIIRHDLPYQIIENEGTRKFFSYLCPEFTYITGNIVKADLMKLHMREKNKLSFLLKSCAGRICLTLNFWTSMATDSFLSLTAHFIDNDWIVQKRILNFCYEPLPHSAVALAKKVYNLLNSWGIEKKIFSITVDHASASDVFVELLKSQLSLENPLVSDGGFFHVQCCAHILNLMVQDGLKQIDESVYKVRECVKYVKGSQGRKQKFIECISQASLNSNKALRQDVPTRWNSTFIMLKSALYYRRAFGHLQSSDSNFRHCPSMEEWGRVEKICKLLKRLYDTACLFSDVQYPTANLYFQKVFLIQLRLGQEMQSSDGFMRRMATQMYGRFEKYWSKFNVMLAIAVVFDPHFKIQFVEFCYTKLYGPRSIEFLHFREKLFSLFDECMHDASKHSSASHGLGDDASHYGHGINQNEEYLDILGEFDTYESQEFVTSAQKSQLELYLDEPRFDRKKKD